MSEQLPSEQCDVLVALRYDTCEAAEKCEACKGVKAMAIAEIERLRAELAQERHRSFQDGRISYMGFNYGVSSQWGIDSLRSAINRNGHG